MENVKKNPIGKIGKVALCGAIAFGSVAGMVGYNVANNTQLVNAVNDETNLVYEDTFSATQKEAMGIMSYNLNKYFNSTADTLYKIKIVADNNKTITALNDDFNSAGDTIEWYYMAESKGNVSVGSFKGDGSTITGKVYVYAVSNYSNINVYYFVNNVNARQSGYVIDDGTMKFMKIRIEDGMFAETYAIQNLSEVINSSFSNIMTSTDYESGDFIAIGRESQLVQYANSIKGRDAFDPSTTLGNVAYVRGGYGEVKNNIRITKLRTIDEMAPVLETQVILADVDSPLTLEYILSQVKFVDEVDGNIEEVVVSDNYSSNMNKVGKWTIEVKATDEAGNTGYGTIQVWVQDRTSPIITGKTTFTSNMSSPITREYIESQLSVSDNVDESVELTLVSDNFTGKENIVGQKTLVYRATDSAGNTSIDYTIIVNCVDDIKPTITGENNYTTSYKVAIDVNTIKNSLILNDNISTELSLELVSDNYTGNESIPGTYFIKYRTTDSAGNISDVFTITIVVNDKLPPVFYTSGLFIGVSQAETLSHQDIVNLLLTMNGFENTNMGVALLSLDGYEIDSVNEPMAYSIRYQLVNEDGTNYGEELIATINVLGEEEVKENDTEVQVEQRVKNLWGKICDFMSNLWKWIVKYLGFGFLWDKENKYNPNW